MHRPLVYPIMGLERPCKVDYLLVSLIDRNAYVSPTRLISEVWTSITLEFVDILSDCYTLTYFSIGIEFGKARHSEE